MISADASTAMLAEACRTALETILAIRDEFTPLQSDVRLQATVIHLTSALALAEDDDE